jgi:hypothetical protein
MSVRRRRVQLIGVTAVAMWLGVAPRGDAQFTPFNDRARAILEGNWQSCREGDGKYAERVYDGKWPGVPPFELHLGPYHEFALFRGIQETHRDHNSPENLLTPHTVELRANRAAQIWNVAGLHLEVALSGGSREECESWYVRLAPIATSSH